MRVFLELDQNEIEQQIPYRIICGTMCSALWDTGKRRRLWQEQFTEQERKKCSEIYKLSHLWFLTTGPPKTTKMTPKTLSLWNKLGEFCQNLT